jgi:predicted transposase/invertase (TIGR01784 family)
MAELLTPKLDYVFKKLFTKNEKLLIDLINSTIGLHPTRHIERIEVNNPEILPNQIHEKFIILDINAYDNNKQYYNIEMQANKYPFYYKRSAYYIARLYGEHLKKGEPYELLEPVIGIHFLNYVEYENYPDYYFLFQFREKKHHELIYTDDLSLHIFELPKVKKDLKVKEEERKRFEWLYFFNHAHEGVSEMQLSNYTNPMIHEAFGLLKDLSADEAIRKEASWREQALRNKISELSASELKGREAGREEGIFEGEQNKAFKIARASLEKGLSIDLISELTGLSVENIQRL